MTNQELIVGLRKVANEMSGIVSPRMSLVIPLDFPQLLRDAAQAIAGIPTTPLQSVMACLGNKSIGTLTTIKHHRGLSGFDAVEILRSLLAAELAAALKSQSEELRKLRGRKSLKRVVDLFDEDDFTEDEVRAYEAGEKAAPYYFMHTVREHFGAA